MQVVLIGAGNIAVSLGAALVRSGHQVVQVYSRTAESASYLAANLHCSYTCDLHSLKSGADIYFVCLKDDVIQSLAHEIVRGLGDSFFVHVAGSIPMDVFPCGRRGVMWPIQSFSRSRVIDNWKDIPLFIEASDEQDRKLLRSIAMSLSDNVYDSTSEDRSYIHLAAVFCNNFSNHCYAISEKLLRDRGVPFKTLLPLIDGAAAKVHDVPPAEAQSGPAVRGDRGVIEKHLEMLRDYPDLLYIYKVLSDNITKYRNR